MPLADKASYDPGEMIDFRPRLVDSHTSFSNSDARWNPEDTPNLSKDRAQENESFITLYNKPRGTTEQEDQPISISSDSASEEAEKNLADRLYSIIQGCSFELGILSKADQFFENIINDYRSPNIALNVLSYIAENKLTDEHVMEGVLHILSNRSFDEIQSQCINICNRITEALTRLGNRSPVLIYDLLISCAEKWNTKEILPILKKLKISEPGLKEYCDEVVEDIQSNIGE